MGDDEVPAAAVLLPGEESEQVDGFEGDGNFCKRPRPLAAREIAILPVGSGPPGRNIAAITGPGFIQEPGLQVDAGVGPVPPQTIEQPPVQEALQHGADAAAHLQHPEGRRFPLLPEMAGQGLPDLPVQGAVVQPGFGGQIAAEAVFLRSEVHQPPRRSRENTLKSMATARTPQITTASQALPMPLAIICSFSERSKVVYGIRTRAVSNEVKNITRAISIRFRLEKI